MSEDSLIQLGKQYRSHIDEVAFPSQAVAAKSFLTTDLICEMSDIEKFSSLPTAYSDIMKLLQIATTLPVTTSSNEHFFSVLK